MYNLFFKKIYLINIILINFKKNLKSFKVIYSRYFLKYLKLNSYTSLSVIKDFNTFLGYHKNKDLRSGVKYISLHFIYSNFKKINDFFINYLFIEKNYYIFNKNNNKYTYYLLNILYNHKIIHKFNIFFRKKNLTIYRFIKILKKKKVKLIIFFDILNFKIFYNFLKNVKLITIGFNDFSYTPYLYSYNLFYYKNNYFMKTYYIIMLIKLAVKVKKYLLKKKIIAYLNIYNKPLQ